MLYYSFCMLHVKSLIQTSDGTAQLKCDIDVTSYDIFTEVIQGYEPHRTHFFLHFSHYQAASPMAFIYFMTWISTGNPGKGFYQNVDVLFFLFSELWIQTDTVVSTQLYILSVTKNAQTFLKIKQLFKIFKLKQQHEM